MEVIIGCCMEVMGENTVEFFVLIKYLWMFPKTSLWTSISDYLIIAKIIPCQQGQCTDSKSNI